MNNSFTPDELLGPDKIAESIQVKINELVRRTSIEGAWLERVGAGMRSPKFDVLVFIYKYGPATEKELGSIRDDEGKQFFSNATLKRALIDFEASGAIKKKDFKYSIQK